MSIEAIGNQPRYPCVQRQAGRRTEDGGVCVTHALGSDRPSPRNVRSLKERTGGEIARI